MGQRTVVVIAGGERAPIPPGVLPADAVVVAADSGVDFAHDLGLRIDVAIGDFDSVSSEGLTRATSDGARVESHPTAKDKTDLELALDEAMRVGASDMIVLGVGGGRLDHLMANLLVLAAPQYAPCRITAHAGPARVHVARGGEAETVIHGTIGELVTILPIGGTASGISTTGLRFPLHNEALGPGTSRGVSNVVAQTPATVHLHGGTLLVVFPGEGEIDA